MFQKCRASCIVRRHFSPRSEFLTTWTKMRPALRNNHTLDQRPAAWAGFSILLIDAHVVVVIASFPPQIAIIVKRGASMLNAEGERRHNASMQQLNLGRGKRVRAARGVNRSVIERFVGIDIAHASHDLLC